MLCDYFWKAISTLNIKTKIMIILKPKRTAISLNRDTVCNISSSGKETYGDEFISLRIQTALLLRGKCFKKCEFFSTIAKRHGILETIKKTKEPSINKSDIFNDYVNAHGFYEAVELDHLSLKKVIICEIVISIADNKQKQPNSSSLREQILKSLVLYQ